MSSITGGDRNHDPQTIKWFVANAIKMLNE